MHRIQVIDTHTGGEPTRVVIAGGPELGTGSMAERLAAFREGHDRFRSAVVNEPRGSDVMVGALILEPVDPSAAAGVIFFNNVGYLGMCGHGTIGVGVALQYGGKIGPGTHRLETPVGDVAITVEGPNTVAIDNVESYRHAKGIEIEVPGLRPYVGDIAWGGNWFFLVHDHGETIAPANIERLSDVTWRIRQELNARGIRGADGGERPAIHRPTARTSCSAPAALMIDRPAAPGRARSLPAWSPTGNCPRVGSGGRRASSAACSKVPRGSATAASGRGSAVRRTSTPNPP